MLHYSAKTFFFPCLFITFLLTILSPVHAAVVVLKNGDRITGRIVKMQDKRLEIDPSFSDIIKIKWEDVESITSERLMSVKLYGEVDMPENAEDVRLDRIILYTLGKDDMCLREDRDKKYRQHTEPHTNRASDHASSLR